MNRKTHRNRPHKPSNHKKDIHTPNATKSHRSPSKPRSARNSGWGVGGGGGGGNPDNYSRHPSKYRPSNQWNGSPTPNPSTFLMHTIGACAATFIAAYLALVALVVIADLIAVIKVNLFS